MLTLGNLAQADQSVLTSVVSQDPVYVYFQPDEQTFLRYTELARKGERAKSANPVRVGLATDKNYPYTGTVNFTVLPAPYQILGYVRSTGGAPITNVNVNANVSVTVRCSMNRPTGSCFSTPKHSRRKPVVIRPLCAVLC